MEKKKMRVSLILMVVSYVWLRWFNNSSIKTNQVEMYFILKMNLVILTMILATLTMII